jgi:SAM-dependent methyltransferase
MTDVSRNNLDIETITKAYGRWAPVYDLVFGAVFERGRQAAIQAAERIGGRILEVGVGTGISLPEYSRANRICGVDISEPMLVKARERVAELDLTNVEGLWVMDAEHLTFPDESVDRDAKILVSPCDAIVGASGTVAGTTLYQIKGFPYALDDLMGDCDMVDAHRDARYVTLRLTSGMYHRFHAPHDCRVEQVIYISGDTWNVNSIALRRVERLFSPIQQ